MLVTHTHTIILGGCTGNTRWHLRGELVWRLPSRYPIHRLRELCLYEEVKRLQQPELCAFLISPALDRGSGRSESPMEARYAVRNNSCRSGLWLPCLRVASTWIRPSPRVKFAWDSGGKRLPVRILGSGVHVTR